MYVFYFVYNNNDKCENVRSVDCVQIKRKLECEVDLFVNLFGAPCSASYTQSSPNLIHELCTAASVCTRTRTHTCTTISHTHACSLKYYIQSSRSGLRVLAASFIVTQSHRCRAMHTASTLAFLIHFLCLYVGEYSSNKHAHAHTHSHTTDYVATLRRRRFSLTPPAARDYSLVLRMLDTCAYAI